MQTALCRIGIHHQRHETGNHHKNRESGKFAWKHKAYRYGFVGEEFQADSDGAGDPCGVGGEGVCPVLELRSLLVKAAQTREIAMRQRASDW